MSSSFLMRGFLLAFLAWNVSALAQSAAPPDLQRAGQSIAGGRAEEAWQALSAREFELAGNEEFDYLLGLAALESGRAARGTFILERVLATNPDHAGARIDMARAAMVQGDIARAKSEFEIARRLNPPPAALAVIDRHLAAIELGVAATGPRASGYAEIGFGHDSNVNAGVSGGAYALPLFGDARIDSRGRRVAYRQVGLGGEIARPLTGNVEIFAAGDLRRRQNGHRYIDDLQRAADYYDTRGQEARLGVQARIDPANTLRFVAGRGRQALDDAAGYRTTQTVTAEWRHGFDPSTLGSLWLQDQRSRHGTVGPINYRQYNGDQLLLGGGLVRGFGAGNEVVAHVSAQGGAERATDRAAGNLDGDKRIGGLRVGGQYRAGGAIDILASMGALYHRYERFNLLFQERRRDVALDFGIGAAWHIDRNWTLKPQYVYTRSDSNIGAYDYDRHDFSLVLRRDFR